MHLYPLKVAANVGQATCTMPSGSRGLGFNAWQVQSSLLEQISEEVEHLVILMQVWNKPYITAVHTVIKLERNDLGPYIESVNLHVAAIPD